MNDRILKALAGESPQDRRPLWIMRQAGRYLPEYRALKEKHTFEELCAHPELAAQVTLQPLSRFPLDAAIIFADLVTPLAALGCAFRFDPGPHLETPIRSEAQIQALREPAAEEIAPETIAALKLVKPALNGQQVLLGFGGSPWSLAAYLVEGRGKEGFAAIRCLAAANPAALDLLMGKLARLSAKYLVAQHRAGADAVQVFDTWAGLLSLEDWRRLVKPHLAWLLEQLERAGVPRLLFLLDAPHLVLEAATLPITGLALDWRVDAADLRRRLGPAFPLQGNLDPAVLLAGPEATRRAARELLARVPPRAHIVNLGHGILPETPLASVEALLETVHQETAP